MQAEVSVYAPRTEAEGYDRTSLALPGLQQALAQNLAARTRTALVAVLVHGGPLDVAWLQESPRFGAILTAWYPGQVDSAFCRHCITSSPCLKPVKY